MGNCCNKAINVITRLCLRHMEKLVEFRIINYLIIYNEIFVKD